MNHSAPAAHHSATDMAVARLSGLPLSTLSYAQIIEQMGQVIAQRSPAHYISITNTETLYYAAREADIERYIEAADFSLCDSIGVRLAGFAWGEDVPRRTGPILMLEACDKGRALGWKHYFYGGKEGVGDLLEARLAQRYPGLQVVGKYTPPFRPLSDEERTFVLDDIQRCGADIVWVGLGLLKQERWIKAHRTDAAVPWMVGVGAAFDYHAGTLPWAPPWLQAIGMEWLYRLLLQPRVRARRSLNSFAFVAGSVLQGLRQRLFGQ